MRPLAVSLLVACVFLAVPGCGSGGSGSPAPAPAPTVTAVVATRGSSLGGDAVTLTGTGFVDNAAGANSVTIGGAAATGVITVNDTTITCTTPPGAAGPAAVAVSNANGTGSLPAGYTYVVPTLYAASGSGVSADLHTVDPATGAATLVGPIGFQITAMDFAPDGALYGITAFHQGAAELIAIDPATGAGTLVGALLEGVTPRFLTGIAFVGTRLLGLGGPRSGAWSVMFEVDVATGALTRLAAVPTFTGGGNPLATDAAGSLYWMPTSGGVDRRVWSVDPVTGAQTAGPAITGLAGFISTGAGWLLGVLYVLDSAGGPGAVAGLASLDPATGVGTPIGPTGVMALDALAGTLR